MAMQLKKDWWINNCRPNYTQKTKYFAMQTALKPESKLMRSGRVSTSYTNSDTRRVSA
jgi:hypothetical protein